MIRLLGILDDLPICRVCQTLAVLGCCTPGSARSAPAGGCSSSDSVRPCAAPAMIRLLGPLGDMPMLSVCQTLPVLRYLPVHPRGSGMQGRPRVRGRERPRVRPALCSTRLRAPGGSCHRRLAAVCYGHVPPRAVPPSSACTRVTRWTVAYSCQPLGVLGWLMHGRLATSGGMPPTVLEPPPLCRSAALGGASAMLPTAPHSAAASLLEGI